MMTESVWLYEITLFIYGLSLVCYTIDLIKSNSQANKAASWLLALAWIMQSGVMVYDMFFLGHFPIITLNEGIYLYGWLLLTVSLIMNRIFPVKYIVFFANLFAFGMFWLAASLHPEYQTAEKGAQLQHEVLVTHIGFTIIAYSFLTLSFLLALMYLLQYQLLKKKKGFRWMWRLSDLTQLDTYSFSLVKIGVPFLFIGLILGVLWGYISGETFYWMDLKTLGSISVLLVYLIYLVLRWVRGYRGKSLSLLNSATFLVLLINFFLFNTWSNFHF